MPVAPRLTSLRSALLGLSILLPAATASAQGFTDATALSGLANLPLGTQPFGAGLCTADFTGDGILDLFVAGASGAQLQLLAGTGNLQFVDATAQSGLPTAPSPRGVVCADIDNDGDQDVFVCNWRAPGQLFVGDGQGHFVEQAALRGITHTSSNFSASFGDFDRDGWLDLYLGNHAEPTNTFGEPNILYRNAGHGVFEDVSMAAGVDHFGWTFAAPFVDFDEDGYPDIYCVNDKGTSKPPNELYRNDGDGTFSPVAQSVGADLRISGMGCDFVDVFGDGGVDLFCTDTPPDHALLCWNPATARYDNETWRRGLQGGGVGWAVHWWDFDNDSHQDLHAVHYVLPNVVYRNPGSGHGGPAWAEVAGALGLGQIGAKFVSVLADFDGDGGLDVLQRNHWFAGLPTTVGATLHHNQVVRGHWLGIDLVGTQSNRDGLGARVEVIAAATTQRQHARSGIGYLSGSDTPLHFGLGTATTVDHITVHWPSGQIQHLNGIPADQRITVTEPSLTMRGPAAIGSSATFDLSIPGDEGLAFALALSFQGAPGTLLPDGTRLPIVFDALCVHTLFAPDDPLLAGNHGTLDAQGQAAVALQVPDFLWLSGLTIHATAMTFDAPRFPLLRTVFPTALPFVIE